MSENESDPEFSGPIAPDMRMANLLFYGLLTLVVLVMMWVFAIPTMISRPKPSYSEVPAMKEVGYALFNFEGDYGSYPNDETAVKIAEEFPEATGLRNPKSAEDYFQQLIVAGYLEESVLERFEKKGVRLTYVVWQEKVPSESAAPLLIAPMVKGQRKFDRAYAKEGMGNKALQFRVDMSVSQRRIDRKGNAEISSGIDFFDGEALPWWKEQPWKLAWPE